MELTRAYFRGLVQGTTEFHSTAGESDAWREAVHKAVSFSEYRIVGQQGERYPENKAQGAEFFGEIWIFLLHPFVDQPGLGLGLVTMAWDDCAMVTNPTTPQINTAGRAPGLGRCGACLILV